MKKNTIPFKMMPGSWGLSGKVYEEAEANYYYEGEELERKLAEITHRDNPVALRVELINIDHKHGKKTAYERDLAILAAGDEDTAVNKAKLDLKYGKITKYEYDRIITENEPMTDKERKIAFLRIEFENGKMSKYEYDKAVLENEDMTDNERKIAAQRIEYEHGKITEYEYDKSIIPFKELSEVDEKIERLHVDYEHHKINKLQFEKELCTLQEKPWVGVIDQNVDLNKGVNGFYIELDWNDYWIEFLRLNGYTGLSDEHIVEQWFSDVNNSFQSEETVAIMPLARHVRNNGTIY